MEMSDEHLEQLTRKKCKDSAKETRSEQAVLRHKSMIELHNTLNSQWNCSRIAPKQAEETKVTKEAKEKVTKDAEETSISVSGLFDRRSHLRTTPTECYELEGFGTIRQSLKLCHENSPAAALEDDRAFDRYQLAAAAADSDLKHLPSPSWIPHLRGHGQDCDSDRRLASGPATLPTS
jgi:hypothetical protein